MKGLSPLAKAEPGLFLCTGIGRDRKESSGCKKGDWLRIYVTDGQIEAQVTDTKKE